jgi:hypothetical protein
MKILFAIALLFPVSTFAEKLVEGHRLCQNLKKLKSDAEPTERVHLAFAVNASVPLQISWIDFEGKLEPKTRHMKEGQRWLQDSFSNHWWMFTDTSNKCRAIYSAQTLSKMKTITDKEIGVAMTK